MDDSPTSGGADGTGTAAREPLLVAPEADAVQRVLVVADLEKPGVREFRWSLLPWLEKRVEQVELQGDVRAFVRHREELQPAEASSGDGESAEAGREVASDLVPDLLVVLGGDGAILGAVRAFANRPVPTVGINFGRVGFLASTPVAHWQEVLEGILAGRGVVEPRMRLSAVLQKEGAKPVRAVGLNDVVVSRGSTQGMISVALRVDDDWVTDYRADGLIVATPSGSTAHSLSAGGPVLFPSMLALAVTPICPQGLAHRPLVLHPDSRLELRVTATQGMTTLAVDGQAFYPMQQGDTVQVLRHPVPYPLLAWADLDPYRRLRERLGWGARSVEGESLSGGGSASTDVGAGGVL